MAAPAAGRSTGGPAILTVGTPGLSVLVFVVAAAVEVLPSRTAIFVAAGMLVVNEVGGRFAGVWGYDPVVSFGIVAVTAAVLGLRQLIARNRDLQEAREELAQLAVFEERGRFARDLHDILGHSLTVIAVKAELAGRLVRTDPGRAETELADLEKLARDALADVRHAVGGYRNISLATELARALEALSAADIRTDLPGSVTEVPAARQELFAWAVREGSTNVVRHSRAHTCTIRLDANRVEITDDGRGAGAEVEGAGLAGLRERAAVAGGRVFTADLSPGFRLTVEVP